MPEPGGKEEIGGLGCLDATNKNNNNKNALVIITKSVTLLSPAPLLGADSWYCGGKETDRASLLPSSVTIPSLLPSSVTILTPPESSTD